MVECNEHFGPSLYENLQLLKDLRGMNGQKYVFFLYSKICSPKFNKEILAEGREFSHVINQNEYRQPFLESWLVSTALNHLENSR